jgi:CRISPR-associated exonuclease Cas4
VNLELLLALLVVAVTAYVLLSRYQRAGRRTLGLDRGDIAYADDSLVRRPTLRSQRLMLAGRPDLLERTDGVYVPVEHKPSSRRLQQSHILQVAALCMLVDELYGVRPPHGVVVLADGVRERVAFSPELERGVLRVMDEMRRILANGEPPGPVWVSPKCRPCGFRRICWNADGSSVDSAPVAATGWCAGSQSTTPPAADTSPTTPGWRTACSGARWA